jgi:hypothetical protein
MTCAGGMGDGGTSSAAAASSSSQAVTAAQRPVFTPWGAYSSSSSAGAGAGGAKGVKHGKKSRPQVRSTRASCTPHLALGLSDRGALFLLFGFGSFVLFGKQSQRLFWVVAK